MEEQATLGLLVLEGLKGGRWTYFCSVGFQKLPMKTRLHCCRQEFLKKKKKLYICRSCACHLGSVIHGDEQRAH